MSTQYRVGQIINGQYEVRSLIGRGAMADVYLAYDHRLASEVAVKVLRQSVARNPEFVQRFRREARVQEMVRHPNVAKLYSDGITNAAEPYLVFELLRGQTLRSVLRKERQVPLRRAVNYCNQALQGLAAVHTLGIHHRDLKPANLMLEPGSGPAEHGAGDRVVLIDFGFASLEGSRKLTRQGYVVGSLSYMAPERLRDEPCEAPAEIYSMGVILYELLVGRTPFVAQNDRELIHAHLSELPPLPSEVAPECGIPAELEDLLLSCLAKEPGERPQSALELSQALDRELA
ncbi:MAG: serine/threonine protein kinase [Proteobacteria bacterium]|nr:serine/threonine protein kinase [Pseudomonadota bacterium]